MQSDLIETCKCNDNKIICPSATNYTQASVYLKNRDPPTVSPSCTYKLLKKTSTLPNLIYTDETTYNKNIIKVDKKIQNPNRLTQEAFVIAAKLSEIYVYISSLLTGVQVGCLVSLLHFVKKPSA